MIDEELEAIVAPFLASDLARDVANVYGERRHYNVDIGFATQAVFEHFRELLNDPDEGPVIFLAVTALQLRDGVLLQPIKEAALALIDSGDAQRAWRQIDVTINRQRRSALAALRERIESAEVR